MRKLLFLILPFVSVWSFGQQSDATTKSNTDSQIRNAALGGVTRAIVSSMADALTDSKVNRSETLLTIGTNDYTITPGWTPDYSKFPQFKVKFVNGNTGAVTVNAIAVKKNVSSALSSGDIAAGAIYDIVYDGTNFQITLPGSGGGGVAWGSITGTLSSQTDLQSALTALQPQLNGTGFVKATGTTISYDNSTYLTALPTLSGDVSNSGNVITVTKINGTSLAGLATGVVKNTTTTGVPSIATGADLPAMTATVGGAVPTPPNNTTTFLRGDGTFAAPAAGFTNPMTSVGDIIQGSTAGAAVRLASVATGNAFISGGVTTANSWGKITSSHIDATIQPTASPTFTGTVTFPTPWTLGATSITSTGTQLNYLNAATGTTGTTSSNLVYSASPTLSGTPLTTTAAVGTNTTQIASTAFVAANASPLYPATNRQTASYTFALTDVGKTVEMNVASANTLTIPPNSSVAFPTNTQLVASQYGAGVTTLTAGAGVTFRNASGALAFSAQYTFIYAYKIGTDEWYIINSTTPFINPMTTLGDIIYTDATPTATRLAGNTSATRKYLGETGTGSVSAAPTWTIINTNEIAGTATNDNATAGNIGEEVNAIVSTYTNYTTTATYQNITSITLTAGDWDISAFFTYSSNSATITAASNAIFVISTTTSSASGATEGKNIVYVPQAALLGTSLFSDTISPYRVSISGSTTYYLNTQGTFTLGNPQYVGSIRARRIR